MKNDNLSNENLKQRGRPKGTRLNQDIVRYSLTLNETLYSEIKSVAESKNISVLDMIRKCIKLGLMAFEPGVTITVKRGDIEREVVMV